jgi:hypothetical protein
VLDVEDDERLGFLAVLIDAEQLDYAGKALSHDVMVFLPVFCSIYINHL